VEKIHIQKVLDQTNGNIAQAAAILKVSRLTMYNKIEKYQLKKSRNNMPH
jgi:DNA-binding NtrC family response regulator